ncbi:MAG: hypothetical protein MUE53_02135 [Chitinophagales bacterium]|jgi:hypothetical protein|nr:hypothetical protein [Chitinophagales bacterium]
MKSIINNKTLPILFLVLCLFSCEKYAEDLAAPKAPSNAEIFLDDFTGMGTNFYFPYITDGAKADVFSLDRTQGANNTSASIRIDVPDASNPTGNFAGASFVVDGQPRDLSKFNALTFYAKASQNVTIGSFTIGEELLLAEKTNLRFTTNWVKYIIPIPDPAKLKSIKGMFGFSAGSQTTGGVGYTFWLDEVKFENINGIRFIDAMIFDGRNLSENVFVGLSGRIDGGKTIFSQLNGTIDTMNTKSGYFTFESSNPSIASIDNQGNFKTLANGFTVFSAQIRNTKARGSMVLNLNEFLQPPVPTEPANNVKSIFSDNYTPASNPEFPIYGGSTVNVQVFAVNSNNIISISNNNYMGIEFNKSPINATDLTHLHMNIYIESPISNLEVQIRDVGANLTLDTDVNNGNPIGDDKDYRFVVSGLTAGQWNTVRIPLAGNIATQKNNLGALILVGGTPNFLLDNIYFYK